MRAQATNVDSKSPTTAEDSAGKHNRDYFTCQWCERSYRRYQSTACYAEMEMFCSWECAADWWLAKKDRESTEERYR